MEMMTVLPKDGKEKDLINIQPLETVSPGFQISKFYSLKIQPSLHYSKLKEKRTGLKQLPFSQWESLWKSPGGERNVSVGVCD